MSSGWNSVDIGTTWIISPAPAHLPGTRPRAVLRAGDGPVTVASTSFPASRPVWPPPAGSSPRRSACLCPQATAPDEVVDRAVLITSELATNTLRHTHSGDPGETFTVRVCTNTRGVHLADQLSTTRPARFWHCGQKSQRI